MSTAPEGDASPAPTLHPAAKTLGVLHVVFAVLLLGMSACCGLYAVVLLPNLGTLMESQQKLVKERMELLRRERLDELTRREDEAQDEGTKARIRNERAIIAAQPLAPPAPEMPFKQMGLEDPKFVRHYAADALSGLLVNAVMLVAGIGLLRRRAWGRSLAIGVAWAKIVRLLSLATSLIVVVLPMMVRKIATMPGAGGDSGPMLLIYSAYVVVYTLIGLAFPIVTLAILARRGVRSSFA